MKPDFDYSTNSMKRSTLLYPIIALICLMPTLLNAQGSHLEAQLKEAIKGKKADIGIAVIINGKDTVTVNNNIHYPMMSVFKFHQALALVDYLEKQKLPLSTKVSITKADLKTNTYSPLRDKYPNGEFEMSVADLLKYTLQQSDNNACDILFHFQGGTKQADKYIHSLGIRDCAIAMTENDMHNDVDLCYKNWTTPLAATQLLEIFLHKPLFAKENKEFIYRTMTECETGKDRLVAPLLNKKGVTIGHKTGTGDRNAKGQQIALNDIGFVILPDGRSYSIAVFVKDSEENNQTNSKIIADISHIVYEYVTQQQ